MSPDAFQLVAATIFGLAVLHTFSTRLFERLASVHPRHAGVWHLLAEVEAVFGFWALVLMVALAILADKTAATAYLDSRNFTEPMFVFAIMVIAGTRPVIELAQRVVQAMAAALPVSRPLALYFVVLAAVPLLGSLITEPAAMTLAALILRDRFFGLKISGRLRYATLGVLFVNVSVGGTLTHFAAPPVLMVAAKWGWDTPFMLSAIGWKAAIAVMVNALAAAWFFRKEIGALSMEGGLGEGRAPLPVMLVHILFLIGVVGFAHHPPVFMGLLLFFLGFATAYGKYQDRLILREGLMVAFFLAGLVVLGGQQQWWLEPLLKGMDASTVYYGATALTAITDNAALTYLGAQVEGLSAEFKYALVTGAVTGGGLTVIANAPNPAGYTILRPTFVDGAIRPAGLLAAALPPTLVAVAAFRLL
jgi:hypothetical protein